MTGNGLKLSQGRCKLDVNTKFLIERAVKHWNRMAREAVESLPMEVFERLLHVAPRDMDEWWTL